MNLHLWPYNWSWVHERTLRKELPNACKKTKEYIDEHVVLSEKLRKPLVMEEFGFPRDGFSFSQESTTTVRDDFYRYVFGLVADNALKGGLFAGCNFWGWGGRANPVHEQWQVGDDYTNDPAQEAQGLNSVFATDTTTLAVIRGQVERMRQVKW
jgi:mannan endo-1,4-beta-mannosidase